MTDKEKKDINTMVGIPAMGLVVFVVYISVKVSEIVYGVIFAISRNLDITDELSKNLVIDSGYYRKILNNYELFIGFLVMSIPSIIVLLLIIFTFHKLAEYIPGRAKNSVFRSCKLCARLRL